MFKNYKNQDPKYAKNISPRLNHLKIFVNDLEACAQRSYTISFSIDNSELKFNYAFIN